MIDVVIIGGKEKTVTALALSALGSDGIPRIIALDANGKLGGSTGPRSPSNTAEEAIVLGGKTKIVDVGIGVAQKSNKSLAVVNGDANQNLKIV